MSRFDSKKEDVVVYASLDQLFGLVVKSDRVVDRKLELCGRPEKRYVNPEAGLEWEAVLREKWGYNSFCYNMGYSINNEWEPDPVDPDVQRRKSTLNRKSSWFKDACDSAKREGLEVEGLSDEELISLYKTRKNEEVAHEAARPEMQEVWVCWLESANTGYNGEINLSITKELYDELDAIWPKRVDTSRHSRGGEPTRYSRLTIKEMLKKARGKGEADEIVKKANAKKVRRDAALARNAARTRAATHYVALFGELMASSELLGLNGVSGMTLAEVEAKLIRETVEE